MDVAGFGLSGAYMYGWSWDNYACFLIACHNYPMMLCFLSGMFHDEQYLVSVTWQWLLLDMHISWSVLGVDQYMHSCIGDHVFFDSLFSFSDFVASPVSTLSALSSGPCWHSLCICPILPKFCVVMESLSIIPHAKFVGLENE